MIMLFSVSFAIIAYTLVIYPGLMVTIGLLWPRTLSRGTDLPTVTILVAACNEEHHIGEMIAQLERLDYPSGLVECVVATDEGSIDRTHELVDDAESKGILRVIRPDPGQFGKNVSMDAAMAATSGEIVVFCDASARWRADAIRKLATAFEVERIGCISAYKSYWHDDGFGAHSYREYWNFEGLIDRGSSVLGYVPNASGGLHAVRRELYRPIPNHMIRDLVDPAQSLGQGRIAVLDTEVPYLDAPWVGVDEVYSARVRITQRALSSTPYILRQLWKSGRPWTILQFVSHKLLRWILWLPLLLFFLSSIPLAITGFLPALVAVAGFIAWFGLAFVQASFPQIGRKIAADHALFLLLSFVAMFEGTRRSLLGRTRSTWRSS